jgi:hypothetical protein
MPNRSKSLSNPYLKNDSPHLIEILSLSFHYFLMILPCSLLKKRKDDNNDAADKYSKEKVVL